MRGIPYDRHAGEEDRRQSALSRTRAAYGPRVGDDIIAGEISAIPASGNHGIMTKTKSKSKPTDQRQRFIDAAREAGASEDEAVFDENLKRLVPPKPKEPKTG
jgi:hypothetical protein